MGKHTKIAAPIKAKPKPKAKTRTKAKSKPKAKAAPVDDYASEPDEPDPDEDRPSLMFQVGEVLQASIDGARQILDGINASTASGETSPALAREAANLNRSIAAISAELRQREKHTAGQVANLSPEETHALVAEYLKEIDYDGRKIFRDIIIELDGEKSLLS